MKNFNQQFAYENNELVFSGEEEKKNAVHLHSRGTSNLSSTAQNRNCEVEAIIC